MQKIRNFTLALALCLVMVLAMSMTAQAAETPALPEFTFTEASPETITITAESGEMPVVNAPNYLTETDAVNLLRTYMIQRKETCTIYVKSESYDYQEVGSAILEKVFVHDGTPTGGDYLALHCLDGGAQVEREHDGTYYLYTFEFEFLYTTSAAQESELEGAVSTLLNRLNVTYKSDYEKVSAVYNYLRNNITYDEAHANDQSYLLQHTAYAALVKKTAAPDGFSTLLYRLLLSLGVDNRIILGETSGGTHCWNIVKLDNVYYNTDITLDAVQSDYSFFLRNSENFLDHYRYLEYDTTRFHTDYPISATDYVPGVVGEPEHAYVWGMCGDDAYFCIDRDKVLTIFGTGETWDYDDILYGENHAPWRYWENDVRTVVIEDGITVIGDHFFDGATKLTSVTFPNTLKTICARAFRDCNGLTSIRIPDSAAIIREGAFYYCQNLKEVTFGSGLKIIETYAFEGCMLLENFDLPEGLETIDGRAFSLCNSLTEVTIPASVEFATGFSDCSNLTTVNLYNENIGTHAFYECRNLQNLNFFGTLASIGNSAFQGCVSLTEITIPETVTYLGSNAFAACEGLKKVTLNNPGVVESEAFYGCDNLTDLVIGDQVTIIGNRAFAFCETLETVTFPESLQSLEGYAFGFCYALEEITFQGDAPNIAPDAFTVVTATAYYPRNNSTWTEDMFQNYDGELTWIPAHAHEWADGRPVYDAATHTHKRDCLICDIDQVESCDYTSTVIQEATIQKPRIEKHTCSVCGGSYEERFACRIFGANRYETSFSAADMLKAELGVEKFDTIIVAAGLDFADALTGSYLAAVKQAPILLVNQHFMDEVAAYVNANLASGGRVYLLGGELAIKPEMEEMLSGLDVKRLAGANRLETNLLILNEAGVGDDEILVCYSHGFADSLSASAVGKPILMVNNRQLTPSQKEFLAGADRKFVIIGGESAVSADMAAQLEVYGTIERIGGSNRYETSINVAKRFFSDPSAVVLAYGANFPDGLCGGPLAYAVGAPLILTRDVNARMAAVYTAEEGISNGSVLGGSGLISDEAVNTILHRQ